MKCGRRWVASLVIVALLICGIPTAQAEPLTIILFASPQAIRADGHSTAQVTAQVRDTSGRPVPDGTEVRFTTTVGSITPVARTAGGIATAMLTAGTTPAISVVSATVDANSNGTQVEFVAEDEDARASRTIKIEGDAVLYTAAQNQYFAGENAVLDYQGLKIMAPQIQYDANQQIIKAQGGVTLTRGKKSLSGEDMVYYPSTNRGLMVRIGKTIETIAFQGDSLEATPEKFALGSSELTALTPNTSKLAVEAERVVLFPGDKIQFAKATVLMDNAPVVKLPHYIISLSGGYTSNPLEQQLRYTSSEGLVLDMPFYFGVSERNSSALRLRYSSSGSDYSDAYHPRRGLSLGFQQDYSLGSSGQGRLMLDSILQNDRRLDLTHRQEFSDGSRADLSLGYQPTSSYAKNTFYGYGSYSKPLGRYYLTMSASQNSGSTETGSYSNPRLRASLRSLERPIGRLPVSFGAEASLGYGRVRSASSTNLTDGVNDFYQTLGLTLRPNSWTPAKGTTFSSSVRAEQTFFHQGSTGSRLVADLNLQQAIAKSIGFRAGYSYNYQTGNQGGSYSPSTHLLTANLYANPGDRFTSSFNVNYGFGKNRSMIATASAAYEFAPTWRLRYQSSISQSWIPEESDTPGLPLPENHFQYNFTQFGIGKSFGNYEISVNYSPQGRENYGYGGSNTKFWLEVGANSW